MTTQTRSTLDEAFVRELARAGVRQFHFSAKRAVPSPMRFRREGVPMGLPVADEYLREYADAALVRRAKRILQDM